LARDLGDHVEGHAFGHLSPFAQVSRDVSGARTFKTKMPRHDISSGLSVDFDRVPSQVAARRPPVIFVTAEVPQEDVRHLVTQDPELTRLRQICMDSYPHFFAGFRMGKRGETCVGRRQILEVDPDSDFWQQQSFDEKSFLAAIEGDSPGIRRAYEFAFKVGERGEISLASPVTLKY
jgi:hypothetical protein